MSFLKNISTAFNYHLISPKKNLETYEDCLQEEEFVEFFSTYKDHSLGCTIWPRPNKVKYMFIKIITNL